jgi:conjugative element/phage-associated large polyvalent protein
MSEYDSLIRQSFGTANPALPQTVGNISEDPDKAARSMELARLTGTPASAIFGDLDEFERNNKAQIASSIVQGNPHISDFIQENPLNSVIANDDYGNLDTVSHKTSLLDLPLKVLRAPEALGNMMFPGDPLHRFKEGGRLGSWIKEDDVKNYPFASAVAAGLGTPIELILRGLGGVQMTAADAAANLTGALGQPGLGRELGGMIEQAGLTGRTGLMGHPAAETVKRYLENGREPPPSVLPEYDAFRAERNAKDVESLAEVVADAQQSLVRERNPDLFRDFIARHTDAEIGVSGDVVAALYGEKRPLPDDGLLGWVPNIEQQLELAKRSGDDISIPLADWVAKVDPEVMKALGEDIRMRPGAITAREAQLAAEANAASPPPIPLPEEVPTVRAASGLEPLFSIGDRKIALQRMKAELTTGQFGPEQGFHDFVMTDEKGTTVGALNLSTQDGGKTLYVDGITGVNGLGPRDFGPALMRDLLRQIKQEFPEATQIKGHRVSGAREAAGKEMTMPAATVKLDVPKGWDSVETFNEWRKVLEGGQWETFSRKTQAYIKPNELRQIDDRQMAQAINEEINRLVPKKLTLGTAVERITSRGAEGVGDIPIEPSGVYIRYPNIYPVILASLEGVDPIGSARHEAIHHLRQYGFFNKAEWATLETASNAEGWIAKHGIDRRYPEGNYALKLEESIAEEFTAWKRGQAVAPEVHTLFERLKALFESIKERISQLLGKEATWEDIFKKVDTGEVGQREGTKPLAEQAFNEMAQVPPEEPSRVFERANALGMSIDQYKRYEKLIEKRHLEDIEKTTSRTLDAQKRVQTKQWKEDRNALRQTVADEINLRPDIAADNYFADGMLYGEKVERIKLGTDFLDEAQKAILPRDYYNKAGAHPDDLAGLFGYPDGASLVTHLAGLSETRRLSGMRPIDFKRRLIDIETDRQMRMKYGVLEDNIMDAVKEQVASETQLSLLHEETLYYGMKSGQEPAFDQQAVKRFVADEFESSSMTSVNSDRYLATAGRAGKAVENALLKGDFAGAFREKQRQYYATLLAKESIAFESQVAKFEKLTNKLVKREVKAVEPEYLDFIHGLLGEAAMPVKRSMEEIGRSKESYGHDSLASFVESKNLEGWDLAVSEDLQNGPAKPLDQMSVGEFREFKDAVTSLNHVGRAVRKIEIAGEKADFAEFRDEVIRNISELPARSRESQIKGFDHRRFQIDASLTRMEEIVKDLDLRKELGPLWSAVIAPMMHSKAHEFDLMTDLSKHFQETRGSFDHKWRKSLDDTINQDILHDPYTDAPYDMTRQNLIQVMLNWGNRSNIGKIVQGAAMTKWGRRLTKEEFPQFEASIKGLIDKHATLQDWQFVQRMWEPFKGWQRQMEEVSRNTSGVVPKMIEVGNVETPFGTFTGGYWPVKYDRLGSNAPVIAERKTDSGVFGGDYFRAATAKGYLKERTGYVDFVDISTSLEQAAGTMQQTIHDIAFRDSLIQGGRVFYDKGIRAAIRKHYGSEYEAQLVPWLRRIAHQFSTDDASIKGYNDLLRRVRINLVGHALPLNLKVILSPDVGVPNPKAWASYLANRSDNAKLAMEKSDEIRHLVYNMDRDFRESMDRITLDPTVSDLQKKAVQWGFVPIAKVSQEFRMSTFVDQYRKALGRGKTEAEAALIADSFVRERHGAASVVDLPAVMQSNESMKMLTTFYGFFNTMYNWQRQMVGNIRRGEAKEFAINGLGSVVVGAAFGATLFNQRKQDDSWFEIIGKALLLQPLSTIPILREASSYAFEGFQPRTPIASLLGAAGSIMTDVKKAYKGERVEKPITHVANVIGLSTGLPLAQVGRTTQFGVDVARGRQRPKNIAEYARGIITGEAKLKR